MINHLRTVLLNSNQSFDTATFPGEEYVDPNRRSRVLPAWLSSIYSTVFGNNPDRAMMNWRLREILVAIYAANLGEYLLLKDSRVTYAPFTVSLLRKYMQGAVAITITPQEGAAIYFLGDRNAPAVNEAIFYRCLLTVTGSTTASAVLYADGGPVSTQAIEFTTSGGLSSVITLPESQLSVRVTNTVGSVWRIERLARPLTSLVDVVANVESGQVSDAAIDSLFDGDESPYSHMRDIWEGSDEVQCRAAALAIALGYRMDEVP